MAFLCGADRDQYQELLIGMENSYLKGVDEYPKMMTAAYSLLTNWKQDTWNLSRIMNAGMGGVAFTNVAEEDEDDDAEGDANTLATGGERQKAMRAGKDKSHIKCFRCGKWDTMPVTAPPSSPRRNRTNLVRAELSC
jgi:hypothetical protein